MSIDETPPQGVEQSLRIRRLQLENEKLEHENNPGQRRLDRLKGIAATSGVITAIVAVIGIAVTAAQWRSNIREAEENRAAARLADGIAQLTSEREPARLGGIVALTSFLHEGDARRMVQVVRALVNQLALETSPFVRSATISALTEFDPASLEPSDRARALNVALAVSRILAPDTQTNTDMSESELQQVRDASDRARAVAEVISIFARKRVVSTDMRGLYLAFADFHGAVFPSGVQFDRSNLAYCNFKDARVERATFRDTDLRGTKFDRATLTGGDFARSELRQGTDVSEYLRGPSFVVRNTPGTGYEMDGPSFDGADLRGASFRKHVLLGLWLDGGPSVTVGASFRGANLDGADFVGTGLVGFAASVPNSTLFDKVVWDHGKDSEVETFWAEVRNDPTIDVQQKAELPTFERAVLTTARAFDGSTWCRAKLPSALRVMLTRYRPSADQDNICDGAG